MIFKNVQMFEQFGWRSQLFTRNHWIKLSFWQTAEIFWLEETIRTAGRCSSSLAVHHHRQGALRGSKGGGVRLKQVNCLLATADVILAVYLSAFAPLLHLLSLVCLLLWHPCLPLLLCTRRCSCTAVKRRNDELFVQPVRWGWGHSSAAGVWFILTCSLWCGDMSLVDRRSLLMSWPITLKVGLSVGSKLQQSVISWYLRGQLVVRFKLNLLRRTENRLSTHISAGAKSGRFMWRPSLIIL